MEMTEIKYFLAVAENESVHQASENIGISPGSLSKAIGRLENELKIKLFNREGRNIRLTQHGQYLKKKGKQLLNLESDIKLDILGTENDFTVTIGGSEILISHYGLSIAQEIRAQYPKASIQFHTIEESTLTAKVRDGEIDLGLSTFDISSDFDQKVLSPIAFNTYISKKHPLSNIMKKKKIVHIDEVLEHSFVTPQNQLLGKINKSDSKDGWRDDKFPRKISFISTSLKTIENLVHSGQAIAYLPDYYGFEAGFTLLNIDGCPYHCKQKVKMFTADKKQHGWLNQLF